MNKELTDMFATAAATPELAEFDYSFETDYDLNNNEAMQEFLDDYDFGEYVAEDHGTMVYLTHPDYDFPLVVVSEGLGDFFSHGITVFYDPEAELSEDATE